MRRIISIFFLCLLMMQAIPVLHFFSNKGEVFYTNIDEEKPDECSKEKMEGKEYLSLEMETTVHLRINTSFYSVIDSYYASPSLARLTPPPDASL